MATQTLSEPKTDSLYGWVVVFAGALITCVAMGAMFALPVYLQPISAETGWSSGGISAAMTAGFVVMGVAGFGWGVLSDRIALRFRDIRLNLVGRLRLVAGRQAQYCAGE